MSMSEFLLLKKLHSGEDAADGDKRNDADDDVLPRGPIFPFDPDL
jgi:hypothetical protein